MASTNLFGHSIPIDPWDNEGLQRVGLMKDILKNRDEDTPRLVFADWLQDHGERERGEFLLLQCQMAYTPEEDPAYPRLRLRERQLWHNHKEAWARPFQQFRCKTFFRRGFVDEISIHARDIIRYGEKLRSMAPIRRIAVEGVVKYLQPLVQSYQLYDFPRLSLLGNHLNAIRTYRLLQSVNIEGLQSLELDGQWNQFYGEEWQRIIPLLERSRLTSMTLSAQGSAGDFTNHLLDSEVLPRLQSLHLHGGHGHNGFHRYLGHDNLRNLSHLIIDNECHFPLHCMQALIGDTEWHNLESLSLSVNSFRDNEVLAALGQSCHWPRLRKLSLRSCRLAGYPDYEAMPGVDGRGLEAFFDSALIRQLSHFDLSHNPFTLYAIALLASSPQTTNLVSLRLANCNLKVPEIEALAQSTTLQNLCILDLRGNAIEDQGADALIHADVPNLHTLYISREASLSWKARKQLEERFGASAIQF